MKIHIEIFWYSHETINDNKNGILKKLEFLARHEVKELVKGNVYDDLELELEQETESGPGENEIKKYEKDFDISIENAVKVKGEKNIAKLKSAIVIDYEPNSSDDDTISSHKYTIIAQYLQIDKETDECEFTFFQENR